MSTFYLVCSYFEEYALGSYKVPGYNIENKNHKPRQCKLPRSGAQKIHPHKKRNRAWRTISETHPASKTHAISGPLIRAQDAEMLALFLQAWPYPYPMQPVRSGADCAWRVCIRDRLMRDVRGTIRRLAATGETTARAGNQPCGRCRDVILYHISFCIYVITFAD